MSREIKFKVWLPHDNIMMQPKDIQTIQLEQTPRMKVGEFESWEYLQYTGLKDCEGKEVYEGDVYRDEFSVDDEHGIDERIYFICTYVKSMSAFCWLDVHEYLLGLQDYDKFPDDLEKPYTVDADEMSKIKILGNIYENPKYLKTE